ncbi:MAG: HAMP domain-containing sensor histidine kinase [Anaerolineales bacterium]|nr:HAMP domain-containing sensor histidine kinase [Anaerolineales bacterium]
MSVLKTLARIRPAFLQRAINRMARGAGVRADFQEQLDQFYDLLIQAVETGYPTWLDSVLYNWAASLTQSDLQEEQSNFIAVAAHELKTPLTLIEGYSAMIRDMEKKDGNGQIDSLLDGVSNGVQRLRSIVNDMIDVSLIDTNLLSLNFQPLWLNQVFGQLKYEINDSLASRSQSLNIRAFSGSNEMIFADSERLYQAFRNILANAIKYTPDGGRIPVDGRILPGFIEVTITDTGIGISPEYQAVIFDKFGQLGDTSQHVIGKTKFKGGGPASVCRLRAASLKRMAGRSGSNQKGTTRNAVPALHFMSCFRSEQSRRIPNLPGSLALKSIRKKTNG